MQEELIAELKGLRSGRGVTQLKLAQCKTLLPLLREGKGEPFGDFDVELLWNLCKKLGGSKQARALINAYAFGMENPWNLTRRRNTYAVAIANEEGRPDYHSDTIELWENQSINELVHLLLPEQGLLPRPADWPANLEWVGDGLDLRPLTQAEIRASALADVQAYVTDSVAIYEAELHARGNDTTLETEREQVEWALRVLRDIESLMGDVES